MKHAGTHWPANAGGEHPNRTTILRLPGSAGLVLILADSARFWWSEVKHATNLAVWRGLPRPEKLPAMLGWDAKKVAAECVNLWDEAEHSGVEWFTPLNELQFCLVPDQRVTALSPTRASMRRYQGDVVTIKTATGNKVTATPNHPILTRQGWLPAGQINESTEVAQRSLGDAAYFGRPDDVQVPTAISEVFCSLQERGTTTRRVIGRNDFHGDGQDGYVEVVVADGLLRSPLAQPSQDILLMQSASRDGSLTANGAPLANIECLLLPPTGLLRRRDVHPMLSNAERGGPAPSTGSPTALLEREQERGGHRAGQGQGGLPSGVTFVQVAHVSVSQFDGHVYGLTTEDECIYADSIVTHNSKESGQPFAGYADMAEKLGRLRVVLRAEFSKRGHDVRLLFPAWVPSDDGAYIEEWAAEADQWDGLVIHCYGSADAMRARYDSYRSAFPTMPIVVGEWNSNHEGHDERASLEMWAEVSNTDPAFLGAAYYIWSTRNSGEEDLSVWGNPSRLALFTHPPVVSQPEPIPEPEPMPMPEYKFGFKEKADALGASVVGKPLEDEFYIGDHHSLQMTEKGVMIYSKEANTVRFLAGT